MVVGDATFICLKVVPWSTLLAKEKEKEEQWLNDTSFVLNPKN